MKATILLLASLLLLSSFSAMAQSELQRFTVTPMEAPRTVAVFPDHPDKAAIIFESTLTNLRFDSQMDGIVQIRDESASGRYILIIEPFTQIISITAPGFIQERMRIGTPQPREVRYFSVAPEERRQDVISVIFNVTPGDARLFVDDQQTDINQTVQIESGNRDIRIEREGYRSVEDQITVSPTNILFTYSLQEIDIVPVNITSNVPGATVTIDGTERGQIDRAGGLGLFLFPGSYTLNVSMTGYVAQNRTLEVRETGANTLRVDLVRNIGELALQLTPSDARVSVNRQDYTGQVVIELAPGRYRLEVEKEGFAPHSETVDIALNGRISRTIALEAYVGGLQLSVTPSNAQVELVNAAGQVVNRWSGVQILRNVQVGRYKLNVSAADHISLEREVVISRDETLRLAVELEEGVLESWTRDTQTRVVDITNPATGRVWMDRNLGASRAATSSTDEQAYGDLYQWGRGADGHQKRNSPTTTTLSSTDQPGHGSFIIGATDWRSPQNNNLWQGVNGINNPCPVGYRLPTEAEWNAERSSWSSNNTAGALASPLKLPVAGGRSSSSGSLFPVGSGGFYWSSTVSGSNARLLRFNSSVAYMDNSNRAFGLTVRCLKD